MKLYRLKGKMPEKRTGVDGKSFGYNVCHDNFTAAFEEVTIDEKKIELIIWGSDLVKNKGGAGFVDTENLAKAIATAIAKGDIVKVKKGKNYERN